MYIDVIPKPDASAKMNENNQCYNRFENLKINY